VDWHISELEVVEELGLTVVATEFYETGTSDFYPMLTKIISKNPDVINLTTSAPGSQSLFIKQIRELGYDGMLFANSTSSGVVAGLGPEAVEGYITGNMDWDSPLISEETKALYLEFNERFPEYGGWLDFSLHFSFGTVNLFAAAFEQAGSLDPDAVRAVLDDPNFRFNYFGYESHMWGLESHGIRSHAMVEWPFSVFEDGEVRILEILHLEAP